TSRSTTRACGSAGARGCPWFRTAHILPKVGLGAALVRRAALRGRVRWLDDDLEAWCIRSAHTDRGDAVDGHPVEPEVVAYRLRAVLGEVHVRDRDARRFPEGPDDDAVRGAGLLDEDGRDLVELRADLGGKVRAAGEEDGTIRERDDHVVR